MHKYCKSQSLEFVSPDEVLDAFRYALELADEKGEGSCEDEWRLASFIGVGAGLQPSQMWELRCTILLKHIGCGWLQELFLPYMFWPDPGGEPPVRRSDFSGSIEALSRVFQGSVSEVAQEVHSLSTQSAKIVRCLRFPDSVSDSIRYLYARWDGDGLPAGPAGDSIPLYARIALLAQSIEHFTNQDTRPAALRIVREFAGRWFDPALTSIILEAASAPNFQERVNAAAATVSRSHATVLADDDYQDAIATAFGLMVDAKSSFTSGHSARVARYTDLIAKEMGLAPAHRRWLRRCALLHDVGKLGVSNALLNKPGDLTKEEWALMRDHSRHTKDILSRISIFRAVGDVASAHHERLDGKGYPAGLSGDEISLETRILSTADVFDALTAARPYRPAIEVHHALEIIEGEVGTAIDPACFAALKAGLSPIETFYERFEEVSPARELLAQAAG